MITKLTIMEMTPYMRNIDLPHHQSSINFHKKPKFPYGRKTPIYGRFYGSIKNDGEGTGSGIFVPAGGNVIQLYIPVCNKLTSTSHSFNYKFI